MKTTLFETIKNTMNEVALMYSELIKETPESGNNLILIMKSEIEGMIKIAMRTREITPKEFDELLMLQTKINTRLI